MTVPGTPSAWTALAQRFGRLPLTQSMAGAVALAQEGFPVSPVVAHAWQTAWNNFKREFNEPHFQSWFDTFGLDDHAPNAGDLWRSPGHAATLQSIAEDSAESFYRGALAEQTVAFLRAAGGHMDLADLAQYQPEWVDPIGVNYRGYDVWEIPPTATAWWP